MLIRPVATAAGAALAAVLVHPAGSATGATPAPVADDAMGDAGGPVELHQGLTSGITVAHLADGLIAVGRQLAWPWAQVAEQDRMGTPELSGDSPGGHALIPEGASGVQQIIP